MVSAYFIGIDVGTQGVRVVLMDQTGGLCASKQTQLALTENSRREQDPEGWWEATLQGLAAVIQDVRHNQEVIRNLKAISVTSTSGTVLPLDERHQPLHPAIMYSDDRSREVGLRCRAIAKQYQPHGFHGFNASSGLAKMVWFVEHFPQKAHRIAHWAHATDFIIGRLSGVWGITDQTNALKSGFDLENSCWPGYLTERLPLKPSWLPQVKLSGQKVGVISQETALAIGLPAATDIMVAAGMTDGCASQVAAGAVQPGSWNTTIGTTLVIKGVTTSPVQDPEDRLYNHLHPEGYWMPGGASNTGADWVSTFFKNQPLESLSRKAAQLLPTRKTVYPLLKTGERFPFKAPQAEGFGLEELKKTSTAPQQNELESGQRAMLLAAGMEGVAFIEKMAFELTNRLSGERINRVYTAGGGSSSATWLQIRSAVLGVPVCKMENVTGAAGAAIIAASNSYYHNLTEAVSAMTRPAAEHTPDPQLTKAYQEPYRNFVQTLIQKGYISTKDYPLAAN